MTNTAIKIDAVSKSFKLPHERQGSIKGLFLNIFRLNRTFEKQTVLRNVSFEVKEGEFFGIVGRNGSGKSTILKLLAGIYSPDKGAIHINGKLTPFIELGVGFNPELTGRQNVYLNGALLGFNRKEMNAMYQDIVDFAEIENFMDQKLKNYSSGMQVRLAFSIAIQAKSDILLLDEVLAVGDAAFQAKCLEIFESYKASDRTVILVTHDMSVVKKYCSRALFLESGNISSIGDPQIVADKYREANESLIDQSLEEANEKRSNIQRSKVSLANKRGVDYRQLKTGDSITVHVEYKDISKRVGGVGVAIYKSTGEYVFGANTFRDRHQLKSSATEMDYDVTLDIGAGNYFVKVGLFGEDENNIVEFIDQGPKFKINARSQTWEGITNLKHTWSR